MFNLSNITCSSESLILSTNKHAIPRYRYKLICSTTFCMKTFLKFSRFRYHNIYTQVPLRWKSCFEKYILGKSNLFSKANQTQNKIFGFDHPGIAYGIGKTIQPSPQRLNGTSRGSDTPASIPRFSSELFKGFQVQIP